MPKETFLKLPEEKKHKIIKAAKKDKKTGLITEAGDMLIFIAGSLPIYGKQILFFKDETFLQRSKINLDNKLSDIIK